MPSASTGSAKRRARLRRASEQFLVADGFRGFAEEPASSIGICQTLSAVFPGTSRSMSTIAAGQMAGLDRPSALEFSFLLSIPTMIAATGWDLLKEIHSSKAAGVVTAHVVMNSERWIVLLIGIVVSFIVAFGVVEWFLMWVRKHGVIPN